MGKNAAFLRILLDGKVQQLQQLQVHNQELQNHVLNTQNHLTNALSIAHHITTPAPTTPSSHRHIKVADPEKFSRDHAETEGFIRAIRLAISVQPESFPDERIKILYALSFMTDGSAHVWAHNETEAVISGTSSIRSFEEFSRHVEEAFGGPYRTQTAHTKLHDLKMTSEMLADEYTACFEILAGRTGFNDAALEDA